MSNSDIVGLHKHSVSDWDFSDAKWQLSAAHFVTPPTSLTGIAPWLDNALARPAQSLVLPEGKMATQMYLDGTYAFDIAFRYQSALGDASAKDCYLVHFFTTGNIWLRYRIAGVTSGIAYWPVNCTPNTWEKWRLTWWNGSDPRNNPALAVRLERYVADAWVSYGDLYDTNNRWKDSGMNRCGFSFLFSHVWIDDTEIWIPL